MAKAAKKSKAKPKPKAKAKAASKAAASGTAKLTAQVAALTKTLGATQKRLEYLEDRRAILDTIYRYCRGLDRHDEELLASAFHWDAVDNHGPFVGYIPEFVPYANAGHEARFFGHTHNITTNFAEINGNVAHTESYVIFVLRKLDGKEIRSGGGRYIDRLEKRNGEWKISLRRLIVDWRFDADASRAWGTPPYDTGTWDKNDPSYMRPFQLPPRYQEMLAKKEKPKKPAGVRA